MELKELKDAKWEPCVKQCYCSPQGPLVCVCKKGHEGHCICPQGHYFTISAGQWRIEPDNERIIKVL